MNAETTDSVGQPERKDQSKRRPVSQFFTGAVDLGRVRTEQVAKKNVQLAHALANVQPDPEGGGGDRKVETAEPVVEVDPDLPRTNPFFGPAPLEPVDTEDPPAAYGREEDVDESWIKRIVGLAGATIPIRVEEVASEADKLWFGHLRPVGTALVDRDSYDRVRHASFRTRVPVSKLLTYLLACGLPKPSERFAANFTSPYPDERQLLGEIRRLPGALAAEWVVPAWLGLVPKWTNRDTYVVRFFNHPYLRMRLEELGERTNRRKYAVAALIQASLPKSPIHYAPKRR